MGKPQIDNYLNGKIDCYIIGSGTSLRGFDFSRLHSKFTIAINHTIEHFQTANCLLFGDRVFLKHTTYDITKFPGLIFASKKSDCFPPIPSMLHKDNVYIFNDNRDAVSTKFEKGLYHPTSSGAMAINLALIMNAKRIYLFGFDFYHDGSLMHFYPDYPHHKQYTENRTALKVEKFRKFIPYSAKIFNVNPRSKLKIFQPINIEAIL